MPYVICNNPVELYDPTDMSSFWARAVLNRGIQMGKRIRDETDESDVSLRYSALGWLSNDIWLLVCWNLAELVANPARYSITSCAWRVSLNEIFLYFMYRTLLCMDETHCIWHARFFANVHTPEEARMPSLMRATAATENKEGILDLVWRTLIIVEGDIFPSCSDVSLSQLFASVWLNFRPMSTLGTESKKTHWDGLDWLVNRLFVLGNDLLAQTQCNAW